MVNGQNGLETQRTILTSERVRHSKVTRKQLWELLNRQSFKCALTGDQLDPDNAVLDHIVPLAKGGSHEIDNLQFVTKSANAAKNSMTQSEFLSMCHRVVQWNK